ncbi:hypothetical protein C8R41DRAFT_439352 [Lentinula lateritia]|uniref:G-protein coupled receptors family 1 profile domain-containing protein n=1 Tax=Lentinula lateritia TaxID=40482 RepID=A0ABQ8VED8_9AGAR|nr:hypothetical protein C8R41DRAFT_439352 [Lentinula lateritia]
MMPGSIVLFNAVEIIGLGAILLVLFTSLFSPSIHRLSSWYMVLGSGVMYSLSMLILAMAHKQSTSDEVPFVLCLVQSALIYSSPIGLMGSICIYAVQFHFSVLFYVKQYSTTLRHDSNWFPVPSLILFLVITIALLIVGSSQPQIVERSPEHFYCHFTDNIGVYTVTAFTVVFVIAAVILIYKSGRILYKHRKFQAHFYQQSKGTISNSVLIRLSLFSLLQIFSVGTCIFYILPEIEHFDGLIVYNALMYNIDVLLLGLNMSIIRAWMFWKKGVQDGSSDREIHIERNDAV